VFILSLTFLMNSVSSYDLSCIPEEFTMDWSYFLLVTVINLKSLLTKSKSLTIYWLSKIWLPSWFDLKLFPKSWFDFVTHGKTNTFRHHLSFYQKLTSYKLLFVSHSLNSCLFTNLQFAALLGSHYEQEEMKLSNQGCMIDSELSCT